MRQRVKAANSAVLLLALVCAGCGSSGSSSGKIAQISFKSPAIVGGTIPVLYTCAGKNIAPPLEWGAVPPGTGELALFVLGFTPDPSNHNYKATVEWAVAGLSPTLHKLAAGVLPPGAHVGSNSHKKRRYSICPKKGTTEQYQFELYAVSSSTSIQPHFNGFPVIATLANSAASGPTTAHGGFVASYKHT